MLKLKLSTSRPPAALCFLCVSCLYGHQFILRKDTITNKENWISLPLAELRKQFTTDTEKKFLEEQIVAKQRGKAHPQDCVLHAYINTHTHTSCMGPPASILPGQDKPRDANLHGVSRHEGQQPLGFKMHMLAALETPHLSMPSILGELSETFQHPKPRTPYTLNPYTLNPGALKPKP